MTAAADPAPASLLIKGGRVWDPDGDVDLPPLRDIVVADGLIDSISDASERLSEKAALEADAASGRAIVLDARGKLVMPGFVNAHYHSYDTLAKGLLEDMPFDVWALHSQPAFYGARSAAELRARTLLGAIECLKSGITTVQDMCTLVPQDDETLDVIASAYAEVGIRVVFSIPLRDVAALDIAPFLAADLPEPVRALADGAARDPLADLAFVEKHLARDHGPRWHWALSLSGPQRSSQTLLDGVAALSHRHELSLFTHVYETKAQTLKARGRYAAQGGSMIRHLAETGLLGPRTTLAHGVWLAPDEIETIAAHGAAIVLNPASNMKLKSGVAPIRRFQAAGVTTALGCDNCSCGDAQNIFQAMKLHCLLAAVGDPMPAGVTAREAVAAATLGGAKAVGLDRHIGRLQAGYRADLAIIDLSDIAYTPLNSVVRQLVYSETGRGVETVIVGGRIVMRDRRMTTLDEDAFRADVEAVMPAFHRDFEAVRRTNELAIPYLLDANRRVAAENVGLDRFLPAGP